MLLKLGAVCVRCAIVRYIPSHKGILRISFLTEESSEYVSNGETNSSTISSSNVDNVTSCNDSEILCSQLDKAISSFNSKSLEAKTIDMSAPSLRSAIVCRINSWQMCKAILECAPVHRIASS
ncbi:hypothetical protein DN41_3338 [Vibrio cholerae]|nr:hypothetical protein DN41_3338 [Vibrio cholerae]